MQKDDPVAIFFSERSLENWYLTGDDSKPGDERRFDLSDSFCIPGLFSFNKSNLATSDALEIHNEGQRITIKKNGDIDLGSGPVLQKLVNESFLTFFDAHTHTGVTTGPGISGPPVLPTLPTHKTTKVSAE